MTLILDDAAVRSAFDWSSAVTALRESYRQPVDQVRYPSRGMARGDHGWLRTLSGIPANDELMGVKIISVSMKRVRGALLIALFDQQSAELVALLDAHAVTGYRTAATSALAADLLITPGPPNVAIIGSGFEAKNHLRALSAIRNLASAKVFSPRAESRRNFVVELSDLPVPITSVDSAEEAVADASLVICAARSRDESPILYGRWLRPGTTVVSIGSTLPEQREVDSDVIDLAQVIIADVVEEVLGETGDLLAAKREGAMIGQIDSLADVVQENRPGRTNPDHIVLYKSVGSAIQDLAVAAACVRNAERTGLGTQIPAFVKAMDKG